MQLRAISGTKHRSSVEGNRSPKLKELVAGHSFPNDGRKLKLVGDQEFPAIHKFLYVLSFAMVPTCIVVHVAFKNFRNTQSKCNDGGKTLISYTFWYKIERRCD